MARAMALAIALAMALAIALAINPACADILSPRWDAGGAPVDLRRTPLAA
jgi:hypothetical protein